MVCGFITPKSFAGFDKSAPKKLFRLYFFIVVPVKLFCAGVLAAVPGKLLPPEGVS